VRGAGLVAAALLLAWGHEAAAFRLLDTASHIPLRWPAADIPVPYVINQNGTPDAAGAAAAVQASFAAWEGDPDAGIAFTFAGLTPQQNWGVADGVNLVTWIEGNWIAATQTSANTIAVTNIWFTPSTGAIVDTDMAFNGQHFLWSDSGAPGRMDVANVGTHEAGHVVGLDHPLDPADVETTMWASGALGEVSKRTPHPDDVVGSLTLYRAATLPTAFLYAMAETYRAGDRFVARRATFTGPAAPLADLYEILVLPDGTILSFVDTPAGLALVPGLVPIMSSWATLTVYEDVLDLILPAGLPAGPYVLASGFVHPGGNPLSPGDLLSARFSGFTIVP
jgi:hypothetical protein